MKQRAREQPFQPPPQDRRGSWGWTGFGKKTLWDWLQLLVVPAMLAVVGFLLAATQENIQQQAEERRAQAQRDAEAQRAQDEALQAYLEGMESLLLEEDLRSSEESDEVRTLAEARTSTVLSRVDGSRKRSVLLFLYKSRLILTEDPLVGLADADLSDADLSNAILEKADLSGADLSGADLRGANLSNAFLFITNLSGADLSNANLLLAELGRAKLSNANLSRAKLGSADLSNADLSDADLSDALGGLSGANFGNADLSNANLNGARGLTDDQLAEAKTLKGATMPDGSKHD